MTEPESRRAQEYMLEAGTFMGAAQEAYAHVWLTYRHVYGERPGRAPLCEAWGLTDAQAQEVADAVDTLIDALNTPGFDQDPPGP